MVKFHCFHIGLQRLVECTRIFADVWDIEDSGRPVGNMRPNIVPIIRSGDHGRPMRWWPSKIKAGGGGGGGEEAGIDVGPVEPPAADDAMIEDADRGDEDEVAEAGGEDGDELGDLLWVLRESYDAPLVEPPPPLPPPLVPPAAELAEVEQSQPGERRPQADRERQAFRRAAPSGAPRIEVPGGQVVYYATSGTFEAQCKCDGHQPRCTWSKKKYSIGSRSAVEARSPVSVLAAWLSFGTGCKEKADHKAKELLDLILSEDMMESCAKHREDVRKLPGGEAFLELEK